MTTTKKRILVFLIVGVIILIFDYFVFNEKAGGEQLGWLLYPGIFLGVGFADIHNPGGGTRLVIASTLVNILIYSGIILMITRPKKPGTINE